MKEISRKYWHVAAAGILLLFLCVCVDSADYPRWWAERSVIKTNGVIITNDYAAANCGQVKWVATKAYQELSANLPGGAGAEIEGLISSFSPTNNYLPVSIGQLKNIAARFYDRLIQEGYTNSYPWTDGPTANDFAPANIGQVKYLFSFDLTKDSDADGMPDWWELANGLDPSDPSDASDDPDNDGLTNLEEFRNNTNPNNPDCDNDGLSDGDEINIYNTDPNNADSDGDGISDGMEVSYGNDPAVSNAYSTLPFTELFETDTVMAGDINGQNNWEAAPANTAFVQTNTVYEGDQALELDAGTNHEAMVRRLFVSPEETVVWGDMYVQAIAADAPTGSVDAAAMLYFNDEGRLVAYDGLQEAGSEWVTLTNHLPVAAGEWMRLTVKLDYSAQQWLVCLNGTLVADGLGFANETSEFMEFKIQGKQGYVDNFTVSTEEIDMTDPQISVASRTPANEWGWNNTDVTVTYEVSDDLSGVDEAKGGYEADTVTTEGENQSVSGSVTDLAGNSASITVDGINIDKTAPEIASFSPADGETTDDPLQSIEVTYEDALSGVDSGSVVLDVGGSNVTAKATITSAGLTYKPSEPFAEGNYVVAVSLEDMADNPAQGQVSFTVDFDGLPNAWEFLHFGNLDQTAEGDADNDGLTNLEEFQYNTDPMNPDTDNDGINDGTEVDYGNDPAVSNTYSTLPFIELFETDTVTIGDINDQNNWDAAPPNTALVQTNTVYEGDQALELDAGTNDEAMVRRLFLSADADVVWGDMYVQAIAAAAPTGQVKAGAVFYFNDEGRLVAYDGLQDEWVTLTNHLPVASGEWVRLTVKLDYSAQQWLVYLNGALVAQGLGFANEASEFTEFKIQGGQGYADNFTVSTEEIDMTDPQISVASRTPANELGWNNTDVTITYQVSDDLSGVDEAKGGYEADTVTTEGENQSVSGSVTDLAGNSASITVDGINIDKTAPEITSFSPADGETMDDPEVPIVVTFGDSLSGVDLGSVMLDVGDSNVTAEATITSAGLTYEPSGPFAEGDYVVAVSLEDMADNPTQGQVSFTVDFDGLPNAWELLHFGNLDQTAEGDADNDGLTNIKEYQLGADPNDSDTDGDGINDGTEVDYGNDPAVSNTYSTLPFIELFETDTVTVGNINGQNNWDASPPNTVFVQTNTVYEGDQALELDAGTNDEAMVRHLFISPEETVVWGDMYVQAIAAAAPTGQVKSSAVFYFNDEGQLVVYDGLQEAGSEWVTLTNHTPVAAGEWARLTVKLDYSAQQWLVCLNGTLVADGLGFANETSEFTEFKIEGQQAFADNIIVSASRPIHLSLDGDQLSDDWEQEWFGSLDQTDQDDPDGDGLSNLGEYLAETDPTSADSDNDGMPDGWEIQNSLDPNDPSDASDDPDSDGLSNLEEFQNNTNPCNSDTDNDSLLDGSEINTYGTNPLNPDTDNDGYSDGVEVNLGFDPTDPASYPFCEWQHRMKLSFRDWDQAENLTNFPVLVVLNQERVDYAQFKVEGADLRFSHPDGTELDFEIEEWNTNGDSFIWVRVPELAPAPQSAIRNQQSAISYILMHWDNEDAAPAAWSDGAVWDDGYAGVWHLNEAGDSLADATANANHGEDRDTGTAKIEGRIGHARDFDEFDHISIPAEAFSLVGDEITVSLWQYGDESQPRNDWCFEGGNAEGGRELCAHIPWGNGHVYWDAFGNYDRINKAASSNEYKGQWNHWVFTKDRLAGTMKIYLNGALWLSGTGKTRSIQPIVTFELGSSYRGGGNYAGIIDEFRVSTVERSPVWIEAQYRAMTDAMLIYGEQEISIVAEQDGAEPDTAGIFRVYRTNHGTNLDLSVNYTVSGTATAGADYSNLTGSVVIPAGALQTAILVSVIDDYLIEAQETVVLTIYHGNYLINSASNSARIHIPGDEVDDDSDGMCDDWEIFHFGDLDEVGSGDPDSDGLTNVEEYQAGTDPNNADTDGDGLSDKWEVDNGTNPLAADADADPDGDGLTNIEEYQAGTNPQNSDTDNDGMPDKWELDNSLDPSDPSDASDDPDSDGLSNLEEYQNGSDIDNADTDNDGLSDYDEVNTIGTDPNKADTDDDGMPDAWELDAGLNPLSDDASEDPDGDGLTNIEEYEAGADPFHADTDNDGVLDGEEVLESYTDVLVADFDGTITDVDVVNGSETNAALGEWVIEGTEIIAKQRRGYVEYTVNCPTEDMYRLAIEATHLWHHSTCSPVTPIGESDLMLYIDGRYLGKKTLTAPDGVYGTVNVFTPWLTAGPHTVRIFWENVHTRISLKIKELRLQTLGGPDTDGDGVKDWVETSVSNMTGMDEVPATSVVSPVCLEGDVRYQDMMACTSGTNAVTIKHGAGDRWYADLDLSSATNTQVAVSFQHGAVSIATNITWVAFNLIQAEDLKIRKGDSLMLTAVPQGATNGTVTIEIAGITNYLTTIDQPVIHEFAEAGTFTVTGTYEPVAGGGDPGAANSITVTVVQAAFPAQSPACMIGKTRSWACTNIPDDVALETDETVELNRIGHNIALRMWKVNKDHYVVARLSEDGPILANKKLHGFWIQAAVDSYMWVVERYEDSALWENRMVTKQVPDTVDIHIHIFIGGVTFDDMTINRWIANEDFDELGEYWFRMIHPNSVRASACHTIKAYQDGVYLGEAYYSGVLMPDE